MIGFLLFVLESHETLNAICLCLAHKMLRNLTPCLPLFLKLKAIGFKYG